MFVILQYWSFVLRLVSALWYERLLRRYAGHRLVKLKQALDLGPMEGAMARF